jgi:SNF2 family DNA or RNA helicase
MHVKDNLIAVPLPQDKRHEIAHFPKHKIVTAQTGQEYLVVPKKMDYALELKRLGLTKAKLTRNFRFLGRWQPFDHQRITVEFLSCNRRAFCLNDMGTGKTASCIWAAEFLRQAGMIKRVMIISLISCMREVWEKELLGICPFRTIEIAHAPRREDRVAAISMDPEYLIINPDGLKLLTKELIIYKPDLIIVDEASAFKHSGSGRSKALRKIIQEDTRVWLLTGTPTATHASDAYGLIKAINPAAVPMSATEFKNMVMLRVGPFSWVPKKDAIDTVLKYMQPAIRFSKSDCLDMPPVTYIHRRTELTDEQCKAFHSMKTSMRIERANSDVPIKAANAAVKVNKLIQIAMGAVYDEDGNIHIFDSSRRLDELSSILEEAGDRCIIFIPFKHIISIVSTHLSKAGYRVAIVDGDVSITKREGIFREFQEGQAPMHLIAHPQTTSHGLNLTRACNSIWYGPYGNPEYYIQANNRTDRPGQTRPVNLIHLAATDFEEKLYRALDDKRHFQDRLLDIYAELTE